MLNMLCNTHYKPGQYRKKTDSVYNVKSQVLLCEQKGSSNRPACYVILSMPGPPSKNEKLAY